MNEALVFPWHASPGWLDCIQRAQAMQGSLHHAEREDDYLDDDFGGGSGVFG